MTLRMPPITVAHAIVLAAIVRIAAMIALPDQSANLPDAEAYRAAGSSLFATGLIELPHVMPLYPIWTYLTGGAPTQILADIALSCVTVYVIYLLAKEIFAHESTAILAALGAAIYPHFVFYAVTGLAETTFVLLVSLAFLLLYKKLYFWGSVALVATILVRGSLDLLAPILIAAFVVIVHRSGWRVMVVKLAQYAAVYVVMMAPWWAHNYTKYDTFVRLTPTTGFLLYSGNNPANKTGGGVATDKRDDVDRSQPAFKIKDPIRRDQAFMAAGLTYIQDNPGRFIELAGIKFLRFWRPWPFAPQYQRPIVIAASLLSFGVILVLTLIYLFRFGRRDAQRIAPVLLLAVYLTAIHMVLIASIRYRLPIEPFMLVLAGGMLAHMIERYLPALSGIFGGNPSSRFFKQKAGQP